MASEYLKWKYRNEPKREERILTPRERRRNWWHYHWKLVALAVTLILILLDIGAHALHLFDPVPDIQIAYVGESKLPDDTAAALEKAFASLAEKSGSGKLKVRLNQYPRSKGQAGEDAEGAAYRSAMEVHLMGDLESCDSFFFILDDGETFQKEYQALARLDGSLPDSYASDYSDCYFRWQDSPALAALDLGNYTEVILGETVTGENRALLANLFVARRGFWSDKSVRNPAACEAIWKLISEGVSQ